MLGTGQAAFGGRHEMEGSSARPADDVREEFEDRLRRTNRERKQLETEFDAATDRWRNERRRLHDEIDSLRKSLEEVRKRGEGSADIQSRLDTAERYNRQLEPSAKSSSWSCSPERLGSRLRSTISKAAS